jgi:hypothetical protein
MKNLICELLCISVFGQKTKFVVYLSHTLARYFHVIVFLGRSTVDEGEMFLIHQFHYVNVCIFSWLPHGMA